MSTRVRIGDILEVPASKGLAHAQFSHQHRTMGALLRILPGFHQVRPHRLTDVVAQRELYVVFFPLQAAVSQGIFSIVAHEQVPEHARPFPLFRDAGGIDPITSRVLNWWLWDGEREWRIGDLTAEQRQLPIRAIWTPQFLVERLEDGWTPSTDPRSQSGDLGTTRATAAPRPSPADQAVPKPLRHYLYFPTKELADRVAGDLSHQGLEVEVRLAGDGVNWLVLASESHHAAGGDVDGTRAALEKLAELNGGEYDGWELAVTP